MAGATNALKSQGLSLFNLLFKELVDRGMKVLIQLFFLLLIFGAEIRELQAQQDPESAQDSTESKGISEESKYQEYKELFGLYCVDQKGTDNYGEGIEALYGTRNFRPILHGVASRRWQ